MDNIIYEDETDPLQCYCSPDSISRLAAGCNNRIEGRFHPQECTGSTQITSDTSDTQNGATNSTSSMSTSESSFHSSGSSEKQESRHSKSAPTVSCSNSFSEGPFATEGSRTSSCSTSMRQSSGGSSRGSKTKSTKSKTSSRLSNLSQSRSALMDLPEGRAERNKETIFSELVGCGYLTSRIGIMKIILIIVAILAAVFTRHKICFSQDYSDDPKCISVTDARNGIRAPGQIFILAMIVTCLLFVIVFSGFYLFTCVKKCRRKVAQSEFWGNITAVVVHMAIAGVSTWYATGYKLSEDDKEKAYLGNWIVSTIMIWLSLVAYGIHTIMIYWIYIANTPEDMLPWCSVFSFCEPIGKEQIPTPKNTSAQSSSSRMPKSKGFVKKGKKGQSIKSKKSSKKSTKSKS